MASMRYFFKRPMMAATSSEGRFQFSVEKAYTVRYSNPISLQDVYKRQTLEGVHPPVLQHFKEGDQLSLIHI